MISRLSHTCIYVLDQERAKAFYTQTLGFELKTEVSLSHSVKWIEVAPRDQSGTVITLLPDQDEMIFSKEAAQQLRELIRNGTFGFGVFECADIYATYEELKAKGVHFKKPPAKLFYGIEAVFTDDSGNWFSLVQRNEGG